VYNDSDILIKLGQVCFCGWRVAIMI